MGEARARVAGWFRFQAGELSRSSPLYQRLLETAADDVARGGPAWEALAGHEDDPPESFLALRFMGAVHRIVLEGRAPDLAAHYPSAGGSGPPEHAIGPFLDAIRTHREELADLVDRPVQTNEPGRSAALVGGFLQIAGETRLPLRILETGASAGLNLRWDHFFYEARGETWGDPGSPVRLCDFNSDHRLPFDVDAEVVERGGCDRNPLDPTTEDGRLSLLSYMWPDQVPRIRRLRAALEVAKRFPVPLERANAPDWIRARLAESRDGVATVLYHSVFFHFLSTRNRGRFIAGMEAAGSRATDTAPLAWLRMEQGADQAETRLKMWPGGTDRLVATSDYHGGAVRWLV